MPTSVTLPALGESVTEGTVTRWLKQVGDNVEADEPLLEVSTDKVDTEIPSPTAGVLLEITAQEDETVEVGAVLAVIGDASEAAGGGDGSAGAPAVEEQAATQPQVAQDIGVSGDAVSAPTSAAEEQTAAEAAP
jgi:pyruvate dehydrogenase E2 component (dihydrolipoamide acetyltransferase)